MGSVSSVNPGLGALFETLTKVGSPLAALPAVEAALEKASPSDVLQLSQSAIQLAGIKAMFGTPEGSGVDASSLLANLAVLQAGPAASGSEAGPSDIVQLSAAAAQLLNVDALFGGANGSEAG